MIDKRKGLLLLVEDVSLREYHQHSLQTDKGDQNAKRIITTTQFDQIGNG